MYFSQYPYPSTQQNLSSFIMSVYAWMAGALLLTASTAYYVAHSPALFAALYSKPFMLIGILCLQLVLVLVLSLFLMRMSFAMAVGMFLLYSMSVGLTVSSIFYIYTAASIVTTFLTTAGMFGFMAIYGYVTSADLTKVGSISMMVLVGLIIGLVINMFLQSSALDMVLSGLGVVIFSMLTAYDMQKIKQIGMQLLAQEEVAAKIALIGALALYLDFLNLFLFLLRFTGRQRE